MKGSFTGIVSLINGLSVRPAGSQFEDSTIEGDFAESTSCCITKLAALSVLFLSS